MKKALRDILLMVTFLAAILLAPLAKDMLSGGEDASGPAPAPAAPAEPKAGESAEALSSAPGCAGKKSLAGMRGYSPAIPVRTGDSFVTGGTSSSDNVMKIDLDGGGGIDLVKVDGPGMLEIDGKHLKSMEVYDIRNNEQNTVTVLAEGLVAMDGGHAAITGDPDIDAVRLDGCLRWNDPIMIRQDGEEFRRYDTYDSDGNLASVSVSKGVRVDVRSGE